MNRSLPATTPSTPRRYLSDSAVGTGQQVGDVGGLQRDEVGGVQVWREADVDQLGHAGVAGAGVDEQAGLPGAERHGEVGLHRGAFDHAGVGVDAARQVGGHDDRPRAGSLPGQRRVGLAQPAPAADAEHAVHDQVGLRDQFGHRALGRAEQPPARGPQGAGSARMGPRARRDRVHGRAAAGEQSAGVQRVAAIVAAAGQHDHPRTVRLLKQPGAHRGQAERGPLHQRALGERGHQGTLGRADLHDLVGLPHPDSLPPLAVPACRDTAAPFPVCLNPPARPGTLAPATVSLPPRPWRWTSPRRG